MSRLSSATRFFYLHGWSSGPRSFKAVYFQERFAELGHRLDVPDLNQGDFYHLTLSRQLAQVAGLLPPGGPVVLLGSSFGALTALWLAERHPQVKALVLLAPALGFVGRIPRLLGRKAMERWQREGELPVYHYGHQQMAPLGYQFIHDLAAHPDEGLQRRLPTLLLHGKQDETIPVENARAFAARRDWIDFRELDDDHLLTADPPGLWKLCRDWLGSVADFPEQA